MKSEPPKCALKERHQDRMTLTHGIARLTYGTAIGHRYNVDSDGFYISEGEARQLRGRNLIGPTTSGLPGTEHLRMPEGKALCEAIATWETEDGTKWQEAEARLLAALADGNLHAIDQGGNEVPQGFWVQHHLTDRKVAGFALRATDFDRVLGESKSAEMRGTVGRPQAKGTSAELFRNRRSKGVPLAPTQLEEAKAILKAWPKDGPPKPQPKTVSEHISPLWHSARSSQPKDGR
jgi:hypothetical protein